mgnify:CR=1 FL=1
MLREVSGDGTRFYELHQGIPGSYGIVVAEMRNLRFAVAHHLDDVIAERYDKFPYFLFRGNFCTVALVEIKNELLTKVVGLVRIRVIKHGLVCRKVTRITKRVYQPHTRAQEDTFSAGVVSYRI